MAPKLIIFDMDDVLYRLDLSHRLAALAVETGLEPEVIRTAIWDSGFEDEAERGGYRNGEEYLQAYCRQLTVRISRERWFDIRKAAMTPIPETLSLVQQLRPRTPIALLTNNGMLLKEGLTEGLLAPEIKRLFGTAVHVSAEFDNRKPEPAVFRKVCAYYGTAPEHALMVDDKPENIDGAHAAGLRGHHYRDANGLCQALKSLGLLS